MATDSSQTWIVCGDLHHQENDRDALLCTRAVDFWRVLVRDARAAGAAGIIQLGDLIDGYHLPIETCKRDFGEACRAIEQSPLPVHPILGNHEVIYLPDRKHLGKRLGLPRISRVVDAGAARFVLFDITVDGASHGSVSEQAAVWLSERLREAPRRPAIICHHPLCHPEDEESDHRHYVRNSGFYRRILKRHPQVALVLTAHRHIPGVVTLVSGRDGDDLAQVTIGCLTAWPVTYGELTVNARARTLVYRERPLGHTLAPDDPAREWLDPAVELARERRVTENPEMWASRQRITPGLGSFRIAW